MLRKSRTNLPVNSFCILLKKPMVISTNLYKNGYFKRFSATALTLCFQIAYLLQPSRQNLDIFNPKLKMFKHEPLWFADRYRTNFIFGKFLNESYFGFFVHFNFLCLSRILHHFNLEESRNSTNWLKLN